MYSPLLGLLTLIELKAAASKSLHGPVSLYVVVRLQPRGCIVVNSSSRLTTCIDEYAQPLATAEALSLQHLRW